MLSMEIEKEINQENKVILGLNVRQIVCVGLIVLFAVLVIVVMGMDFEVAIIPMVLFAAVCGMFGWYKPDGIPFERVLLKKVQTMMYGSNVRKYKTKNQYVTMLNEEYSRRRNIDAGDKKLMKRTQKAEKKKARTIKKAQKRAVCRRVA